MKNAFLTMKVEPELKKKIERMAQLERRSFSDQAAFLAELGIKVLEHQTGPEYAERGFAPMGAVREEAIA